MKAEEALALSLADALRHTFAGRLQLSVEGAGVNWLVRAVHDDRSARVNAFVIEGIDPHHELRIELGDPVEAVGRSRSIADVVAVIGRWCLHHAELSMLAAEYPFVDAERRTLVALRSALAAIAPALVARFTLTSQYGDEFWSLQIVDGDRGCVVRSSPAPSSAPTLELVERDLVLATAPATDAARAVALIRHWLEERRAATSLTIDDDRATPAPFAAAYERGELAGWRWDALLARTRNEDHLEILTPLVERLARRPLVRRYFPFTSMTSLCLSRCSEYPFSTSGLPNANVRANRRDAVAGCDRDAFEGPIEAVASWIESRLVRDEGRVWIGSSDDDPARR